MELRQVLMFIPTPPSLSQICRPCRSTSLQAAATTPGPGKLSLTVSYQERITNHVHYHCLHGHQFPLLLEPVGVPKLSISLWAREILTLSRGVPSSPVSIANIFIFSLKLSFSGRGPVRVDSNFWCCAASSLARGSLNTTQMISLVCWTTLYLDQYCDKNDDHHHYK